MPSASIKLFGSVLLLCGAVGCGSDVTTGGGEGGGSDDGGGGSIGEGGSAPSCEDFREPMTGEPDRVITVRIRNETGSPFFLGDPQPGCDGFLGFTLTDEAGNALKPRLGICEFTCSSMLDSGCGCPAFCESPQVIDLQPGGVWTTAWPLAVFPVQDMPATCYFEQGCEGNGCFDRQTPDEPLVFRAQSFTALGDCIDECSCTPNDDGWCVLNDVTMTAGMPATATATWNPNDFVVEIVFE